MSSLVFGSVFSRRIRREPAARSPIRRRFRLGVEPLEDRLALSGPTVTSVSPSTGSSAGGDTVTIGGTNFTGVTAVDFGPTAANPLDITVINVTTIQCVSPPGTGAVDVTVTTSAGTSPSNPPGDQFTYTTSTVPTVTNVNPNSGPVAGGTSVTITGTNFTGTSVVDFGTIPVTSFSVNSAGTQITTASPAAAGPGAVDVTVTTPSGTSPTSPSDVFTYVAPATPAVTGLNPTSGPTSGGTTVTIGGVNFDGASAVDFGTVPAASFTVVDSTTITAVSPVGSGPVHVTVTTPAGTSTTSSADLFTYILSPPTVTAISPSSGPTGGGTMVTITGTNFSQTGRVAVLFGSNLATNVTVLSPTTITAASPAGTGPVDVVVYVNFIGSATSPADVFIYTNVNDGPRVISVARYGYHRQSTYFVIAFNMPLDSHSAQLASNYLVAQSMVAGLAGQTVPVKSATYNPANNTVTLAFPRRLLLRMFYTLTINGTTSTGVKSVGGLLLDGAGNGRPGSNYVTTVSQSNLAGSASQRPVATLRHEPAPSRRGGPSPQVRIAAETSRECSVRLLHLNRPASLFSSQPGSVP
jgi:hypothetical protein